MKENAFESAIALLGLVSGGMAVMLANRVATPPSDMALYSADAVARMGVMEAGLAFFLGAAVISASVLFLRRGHKTA